ncbi:hypothetical protein [Lysinibacillus parviboronicapiens]|uniref:hypothetical protein n=1 Tax=Lysinibacillus parviboronicapiens TaxID=436516 RepID=UPI000D3834F0|nr:hypothetical protein [Lysinibacillus parviboronicapiens]
MKKTNSSSFQNRSNKRSNQTEKRSGSRSHRSGQTEKRSGSSNHHSGKAKYRYISITAGEKLIIKSMGLFETGEKGGFSNE